MLFAISAWSPDPFPVSQGGHYLLGVDSSQYPYASSNQRPHSDNDLELRVRQALGGARIQAVIDGEGVFAVGTNSPLALDLHELYVSTAPQARFWSAGAGRKLEAWSRLDETWQLGLWQPRFRLDDLETERTGLFGVFAQIDRPGFHFVVQVSPGFLPEQGRAVSVEGGSIHSSSPWFHAPPSQIAVLGQSTQVNYVLSTPSLYELLAKPGAAVHARFGASGSDTGFWAAASYAYLPMNQLLLAYDGHLNASTSQLDVTLSPRSIMHHLASLESGYSVGAWGAWVSASSEVPVEDTSQGSWTIQTVTPSFATDLSIDWIPSGKVSLNYLHQSGGNSPDSGPLEATGSSLFEYRYPYQNALLLEFSAPPQVRFGYRLRTIYDVDHSGLIFSPDFVFRWSKTMKLNLGADVLASSASSSADGGFVGSYIDNSRIRTGVSYVF